MALWSRPDAIHLDVERTQSAERVRAHQLIDVHLTVRNAGSNLAEVRLWDRVPRRLAIVDGDADALTSLAPGDTVELTYTLQGARGDYHLPGILAEARDPFGLFAVQTGVRSPARLLVLRALAQAEIGDHPLFEELDNLPTRLFPTRAQLVLVSPLAHDDFPMLRALRARGYALAIVAPDAVRFERQRLADRPEVEMAASLLRSERRLLIRQLRAVGIHVVDWNVETPLEEAIHRAWRRMPRWTAPQRS